MTQGDIVRIVPKLIREEKCASPDAFQLTVRQLAGNLFLFPLLLTAESFCYEDGLAMSTESWHNL
jgi:hypothetical protein